MTERPIDRIKMLADWLIENGVIKSIYAFERVCGLSKLYVRNLLATQKGNPGIEVVARIYDVFPMVSIEWLVTGRGNMWKRKGDDEDIANAVKQILLMKLI